MLKTISNYRYILVAILIGLFSIIYYLQFVPNDITWRNVSYDSTNYLIAAKYLRLSHPSPGSPLYNLFNATWIRVIPFGTDYFKIALISVIASAAAASTLYYYTRNFLAPLLWLSSTVVLSQSTVLEQYTLVALFCLVAFILYEKGHRNWAYTVLSFGVMVNHLCGFLGVFFLSADYFQKQSLKPFLFIFLSLPLLAYVPLVNREPYIFINGSSFRDYWNYFFSQGGLLGGLSVVPPQPIIQRSIEFGLVVIASVGIVLPLIRKIWGHTYAKLALIASCIFAVYYLTNLSPQTYTYLVPAVALFAYALGKVSCKLYITCIISIAFAFFVIGNLVLFKPDHTAAISFYSQLYDIPSDSTVWSENRGWEKTTIELFNLNEGTSIDQVNLRKPFRSNSEILKDLSFADYQGKLFRTVITNPETYKVIIVRDSAEQVMTDYLNSDIVGKKP